MPNPRAVALIKSRVIRLFQAQSDGGGTPRLKCVFMMWRNDCRQVRRELEVSDDRIRFNVIDQIKVSGNIAAQFWQGIDRVYPKPNFAGIADC